MSIFIDTSALVKLYVAEAGSAATIELVSTFSTLYVSALTEFEFLSAITRRRLDGDIPANVYESLRLGFYADWSEIYVQQPFSDAVFAEARILLGIHQLRTLDAFQLASAIVIHAIAGQRPAFLTTDKNLGFVAKHEGFEVIDVEG